MLKNKNSINLFFLLNKDSRTLTADRHLKLYFHFCSFNSKLVFLYQLFSNPRLLTKTPCHLKLYKTFPENCAVYGCFFLASLVRRAPSKWWLILIDIQLTNSSVSLLAGTVDGVSSKNRKSEFWSAELIQCGAVQFDT